MTTAGSRSLSGPPTPMASTGVSAFHLPGRATDLPRWVCVPSACWSVASLVAGLAMAVGRRGGLRLQRGRSEFSDEPRCARPGRGRGAGGEAELAEDAGQVPVHGVLAEHELLGDVGVGQSLRDEFE